MWDSKPQRSHEKKNDKKREVLEYETQTEFADFAATSTVGTQTELDPIIVDFSTTEIRTQIDLQIFITREENKEHVPPYTPLIVEDTIWPLNKIIEEQQETIAQYLKEVVP